MFTQAALQVQILGTVVLTELVALVLSEPYWRTLTNPFGLF